MNDRKKIETRINELRKDKTIAEIVDILNQEGFKNNKGNKVKETNVHYILYGNKYTGSNKTIEPKVDPDKFVKSILLDKKMDDARKIRLLNAYFNV